VSGTVTIEEGVITIVDETEEHAVAVAVPGVEAVAVEAGAVENVAVAVDEAANVVVVVDESELTVG
jgi:hypothetical protein